MANRRPIQYPRFQAFDDDETFLNGGTITFYDAGTTNKRNVYQDPELNTTAPNPVNLNSRGEPEAADGTAIDIYLDGNAYKVVLKDSAGTTVHTIDNFILEDLSDILEPKDPADATDPGTDAFQGTLNRDPNSGEEFVVDFQSANTTTTPTFENTNGSLGALTIKTRDGSALWSGALNGVHELQYDGTDYLVVNLFYGSQDLDTDAVVVFQGYDPEHATDGGTDAYASATNTSVPGDGVQIVRDFQSANTTTTPTLDGKTITDRNGNALWSGAISGVHSLQRDETADTYLLLYPIGTDANVNNAPVKRDSSGRAKFSDPSAAQDAATKNYTDTGPLQKPGTSSDPALAFDTWRTPNANRPTLVELRIDVTTDGTSDGVAQPGIDESGGTTPDYNFAVIAESSGTANGFRVSGLASFIVNAGGSYQINNSSDPASSNAIQTHQEFTL